VTFRAAEIHYFRVPRHLWELYLVRAGQCGADTIPTYMLRTLNVVASAVDRGCMGFGLVQIDRVEEEAP
jgi:hypothetical protein